MAHENTSYLPQIRGIIQYSTGGNFAKTYFAQQER